MRGARALVVLLSLWLFSVISCAPAENIMAITEKAYQDGYSTGLSEAAKTAESQLVPLYPPRATYGMSPSFYNTVYPSVKPQRLVPPAYKDGYNDGYQAGLIEGQTNGYERGYDAAEWDRLMHPDKGGEPSGTGWNFNYWPRSPGAAQR
jgi:hypothetical protein